MEDKGKTIKEGYIKAPDIFACAIEAKRICIERGYASGREECGE